MIRRTLVPVIVAAALAALVTISLRDIVDYELIATIGLLETAADRRETLLRQIYEATGDR